MWIVIQCKRMLIAYVEKMKQELFPVVDLYIKKAQKKQKAYYDKRHRSEKYQLGDLVLVKNMLKEFK